MHLVAHLCIIPLMDTPLTITFVAPPLYQFNKKTLNKDISCATVLYFFICVLFLLFNLDTMGTIHKVLTL